MSRLPDAPLASRRSFLRGGLASLGVAMGVPLLARCDGGGMTVNDMSIDMLTPIDGGIPQTSNFDALGPLGAPDANGIRLPAGFTSRIVARTGEEVAGTGYVWHVDPDGGATFLMSDGGWVYVSNSEVSAAGGGVSAIRFDRMGDIVDAYRILGGTWRNCAGGHTPWGTWLSCEEVIWGTVYECDPTGATAAVQRLPLGSFRHEAAAVDIARRHVYLTEDEDDGRFYRFTSPGVLAGGRLDLSSGTLEVMRVLSGTTGAVEWLPIANPNPGLLSTPTRNQQPTSTEFNGGEGMFFFDDAVYFATKGDSRVWVHDVVAQTVDILYDPSTSPTPVLVGVDNVHVSPAGDVLVAEEGGNMEICVITPSRMVKPIVQVTGQDSSEITGPALDPYRRRLYFSSQRGTTGTGITYEVTGPFFV